MLTGPLPSPSARARELGLSQLVPMGFDDFFAACVSRASDLRYQSSDEAIDGFEVLVASRYRGALPDDASPMACLNIEMPDFDALRDIIDPLPPPPPPPPQPCLKVSLKSALFQGSKPVPCLNVAPPPAPPDRSRELVPTSGDGGPYRTVFRPATDRERAARRRRYVAYVGVAVTATLVALWLARRC